MLWNLKSFSKTYPLARKSQIIMQEHVEMFHTSVQLKN